MENESASESGTTGDNQTNLSNDETTWGMIAHLSGLAGLLGIPFGNLLGPLVVWLIKKDEMPFVDREGKEALNFQISISIYGFVVAILSFLIIGIFLIPILLLAYLILTIMAAVKAKEGNHYRYPMTIRLIK